MTPEALHEVRGSGATSTAGSTLLHWRWEEAVAPLRHLLTQGGVLAIPSESSYGLAVLPGSPEGVDAIYRLKERERGNPLPVIGADSRQLASLVDAAHPLFQIAARVWPAPLTIVVPSLRPLAATRGATLGVRVPAHPRLRALLAKIGSPLTATSANRAGEPPILDPTQLPLLLEGTAAGIVEDGVLGGGPPSTVVGWGDMGPRLLRAGAFPFDRVERAARNLVSSDASSNGSSS